MKPRGNVAVLGVERGNAVKQIHISIYKTGYIAYASQLGALIYGLSAAGGEQNCRGS